MRNEPFRTNRFRTPTQHSVLCTAVSASQISRYGLRIAVFLSESSCGTKKVKIISTFKNATESHPKRSLHAKFPYPHEESAVRHPEYRNVAIFRHIWKFSSNFSRKLVQISIFRKKWGFIFATSLQSSKLAN